MGQSVTSEAETPHMPLETARGGKQHPHSSMLAFHGVQRQALYRNGLEIMISEKTGFLHQKNPGASDMFHIAKRTFFKKFYFN